VVVLPLGYAGVASACESCVCGVVGRGSSWYMAVGWFCVCGEGMWGRRVVVHCVVLCAGVVGVRKCDRSMDCHGEWVCIL
jgi:hypothetical protein